MILVWGPQADLATAVETIEERCRWAFVGVPNETRKAMLDGTTIFERVLPGPDRMYPDTDSAPIPIDEEMIAAARSELPTMTIAQQLAQLRAWTVPQDAHRFILRKNLFAALQDVIGTSSLDPRFAGTLIGHVLRSVSGGGSTDEERFAWLVDQVQSRHLAHDILKVLVPLAVEDADASFGTLLERAGFEAHTEEEIVERIDGLRRTFGDHASSPGARRDWIMGQLRPLALGNVPLRALAMKVEEALR